MQQAPEWPCAEGEIEARLLILAAVKLDEGSDA